jgi:hypothetical protein
MTILLNNPRLKANSNLTQYTGTHYAGLPILIGQGPFIEQYLQQTLTTLQRALADYPRLLAVRFDLRYPHNLALPDYANSSVVMSRFVESLKAKITHNRSRAAEINQRVHDTVVRYVWVKEFGVEGRPHYHFLLLLNKDAFHALGQFNSDSENLYTRIVSAWASALRLKPSEAIGLVHIPKNSSYRINSREDSDVLAELFNRVSYMCKVDTKRYGEWERAFGCSRN